MDALRHMFALAITVLLGVVLYYAWVGFKTDLIGYAGLARELRGTWLWDLRHAAIPLYAVAALWVAEKLGTVFNAGHR